MISTDMMLSKVAEPDVLIPALAQVVGISADRVCIIDEHEHWSKGGKRPSLRVHRYINRGQFPMRLDCNPVGFGDVKNSVEDVSRLCGTLACEAIIPDETLDPYAYLLISPGGRTRKVSLDLDRADDKGEYFLEGEPSE